MESTLVLPVLILANFATLLVGLFTLSKNPKSSTNVLFSVIAIALIGWTTANYFSYDLTDPDEIFLAIKLVFSFVIIQNSIFFLFARSFPDTRLDLAGKTTRAYLTVSFLILLGALTGVYFKGYAIEDGNFSLVASPLIIIFLAHAVISIGGTLKQLVTRHRKANGSLRNQLTYLLVGSFLLLVVVPLTNFLLPIAFGINNFVPFSPVYTFVFSAIIAYAIIWQKLFDIRLIVARTVAYVLALVTFGLVYGISIFGISALFLGSDMQQNLSQQGLYIGLAVLLMFTFQPTKKFFDKASNRLFFRDAYDPQLILDKIGEEITAEVDSGAILFNSLEHIEKSLKPMNTGYIVVSKENKPLKAAGSNRAISHLGSMFKDLSGQKRDVLVVDERPRQTELIKHLKKYDVAISVKLETNEGVVGYILIGPKRSGNIYTSQDIKLLRIAASELSVAVQNARRFDEIQAFNITLQQKIDEATKELRQTNQKLRELDEAKDEFISMASHQLRTPLTSMKGYISMVVDGDAGKITKEQRKLLDEAFASSQRMVYLIADMLNVSRLKTGKFNIEKSVVNLPEVVASEIDQLMPVARAKDLDLTYHVPEEFPPVYLDETKIRQVVMNFADNAVHYTPKGGKIEISLIVNGEDIEYTVKDNGIGVSKAEAHKLFTKFFRASNARQSRPDGTGLGLYMAQKVISAQDGTIIFESELGKGSTFGFRFPLAKLKPPKNAAKTAD